LIVESLNNLLGAVFGPFEGNMSAIAPAGLLALGLVTGLRHSLEADHIAAVSTIVAGGSDSLNKFRRAPLLGVLWGLGHTASLFVVGLIVLLLAISIPEKVSGMMEFGVGIMLIFLGVTALTGFRFGRFLRGMFERGRHAHVHAHEDIGFVHLHEHEHKENHKHGHKSLIVGMVHGMAGSGALLLLVLSTIQSVPLGLAYIAIFGAGSIAGMTAMSTLIGLPFARFSGNRRLSILLRYVPAFFTIVIGVGLMYQLGVVEGVFMQ
jgi:hypothetical protein